MEQRGELIFIPFGGSDVFNCTHRLAPLGIPEFHLYDHELPPETEKRLKAAQAVNARPVCEAVLTRKRNLENYLHSQAIRSAGDVIVAFDDFDSVADLTAKQLYQADGDTSPWELLPKRARSRKANRAKRWLNTTVADQMTLAMLNERDADGELKSWVMTIRQLANSFQTNHAPSENIT